IASESYLEGGNVATKVNFLHTTDPAGDNDHWTEASLYNVSHWGLCYKSTTAPGTIRLANMCIEVLHWNNGKPLVYTFMPGPAAYFSGPWVKSDDDLAYFAHVNKMPRSGETYYADTTSL